MTWDVKISGLDLLEEKLLPDISIFRCFISWSTNTVVSPRMYLRMMNIDLNGTNHDWIGIFYPIESNHNFNIRKSHNRNTLIFSPIKQNKYQCSFTVYWILHLFLKLKYLHLNSIIKTNNKLSIREDPYRFLFF